MEDKMFELMTKMYNEFSEFRKDTKADLTEIKNDIVRIENKLDDNSKALFDGYNQTYEKVVEVEKAVKELSSKVETQEVEIKVIKGGKA
jgi:flagellin-like hook-associated protein FlgL